MKKKDRNFYIFVICECEYFKLNAKFKVIWFYDFLFITASKLKISFS